MAETAVGLERAFTEAVKRGEVHDIFCTQDVRSFARRRGMEADEGEIAHLLERGAAPDRSPRRASFRALGNSLYTLTDEAWGKLY